MLKFATLAATGQYIFQLQMESSGNFDDYGLVWPAVGTFAASLASLVMVVYVLLLTTFIAMFFVVRQSCFLFVRAYLHLSELDRDAHV